MMTDTQNTTTKTKSRHALAAAALRAEIKAAFPAVKFTCKSSRYSGGSSLRVEMDDQPRATFKAIERIANKYQYGHFDGMTDCYEFSNKNENLPQVKFVFTHNNMSAAMKQRIYSQIRLEWEGGRDLPESYEDGCNIHFQGDYISQMVWREWCKEDEKNAAPAAHLETPAPAAEIKPVVEKVASVVLVDKGNAIMINDGVENFLYLIASPLRSAAQDMYEALELADKFIAAVVAERDAQQGEGTCTVLEKIRAARAKANTIPRRFVVETRFEGTGETWENCWTDNNTGLPLTFSSRDAAQEEINDHIKDCINAVEGGDMQDSPDTSDFRIIEIA